MEKTSHLVPEPSVKERQHMLLDFDLNELPVDMSEEPKDDVAPPPLFVIDLCFHNEDMKVIKQKHKVLGSSSSYFDDEKLENLGFPDGCLTMMCIRDKRAKIAGNSFHALGRSWFREVTNGGVDWMVSLPESISAWNKQKEKKKKNIFDHLVNKMLIKDFVMEAKARASAIRKKGKKKVRFAFGPRDGIKKKKFVSKKQSSNGITIIDKEKDV